MRVLTDLDNLPELHKTVLTIGSFDGLHFGHQRILDRLKQLAKEAEAESLVITFHPHPREVLFPNDDSLRLLSTLEEKKELLETYGIDNLAVIPFTKEFSKQTPEDYIQAVILRFNPSHIVIGYDHRFGANREGDINLLRRLSSTYGYDVTEISKQQVEDITISSTKIRNALAEGKIETANSLLDRAYSMTGAVVKGKQLGAELGYPTANLKLSHKLKLVPKDGIYVCTVELKNQSFQGMLYIGKVPTLDEAGNRTIEVNIFAFAEDIYGQEITLSLLHYLRDDHKFEGLSALKAQLKLDKENSLAYFSSQKTAEQAKTSVVILNYNSSEYLETFLPSVSFSSKDEFETIVIDNASTDNSVDLLEEWFPEVKIVSLNKNYGFAEGYNRGLAEVKSEYIAFLNSDVEVEKGWLDPLVEFLDSNEEVGAVMPKILSCEDKSSFEYAGACGGYMDILAYPFCRGRIFDQVERDSNQYDESASVAWVSGAAFVMRRKLFEDLGGFDGSYFAHQEEIDLCWKIRRAGYKLYVLPQSTVFHVGGGTLNYGSTRKLFLNFRNSLSNLFKNEKGVSLLWKLPLRLVLDGVAGIKFLVSFHPSSCWAIVKAHFAFYTLIPSLIKSKRADAKRIEQLSIGPEISDGYISKFIVFQYFVKGIKTFSKLNS